MLEKLYESNKNKNLTKLQDRITSQIRFAAILSRENNGQFDALVNDTEQFVLKQQAVTGGLTVEIVKQAEDMLSPIAKKAKEYTVLCVAHAHIDMNWLWGFEETVGVTVDTFTTMLQLMEEYPDYTFSQSQASVYKIVEEYYPEMLERIKARVKEGRWEITASTWVETDKNMPNGESLSRHILYTKDYINKLFDIPKEELVLDFEPDTFGHNKNVPAILNQGGIKYYYHCRGYEFNTPLYRWVSQSGEDILVYREPSWYNAEINTDIVNEIPLLAKQTFSNTVLKVYGVGDHGGGPTRRDINRLIEYNTYPCFPNFKFSTFREYFDTVSTSKDKVPVINKEQNFLCDGCYTTQSTIKAGNRKSENMLYMSEAMSALSHMQIGSSYPYKTYKKAWEKVLFNQFHDILPGSGVTATREYASGLYQEAIGMAQTNKKIAIKALTDNIDTSFAYVAQDVSESCSEGAGVGQGSYSQNSGLTRVFHVFNNTAKTQKKVTEVYVWDYEGDLDSVKFYDSKLNELKSQRKTYDIVPYWGHTYAVFFVEVGVKPFGYSTIMLKEEKNYQFYYNHTNDMRVQHVDEFILENDLLRVELSPCDGSFKSIIVKATGEELATNGAGLFKFADEAVLKQVTDCGGGMSAWFSGRYKNIENITQYEIIPVEKGALNNSIKLTTTVRNDTKITVLVSLEKGSLNINFKVSCDFREFGSDFVGVPTIYYCLALPFQTNSYKYDVPFGVSQRNEANMDYPGNSFIYAPNDNGSSLMLISKTKYGFRGYNNAMNLTLIRGAYNPDQTPETYHHEIEFAVGVVAKNTSDTDLVTNSKLYNCPLKAWSGKIQKGSLDADSSMLNIDGNICVSSVKLAEKCENAMIIRLYEVQGNDADVTISLTKDIKSVCFVDINEEKVLAANAQIIDSKAKLTVPAYNIRTVKITFK